jgi:hypothetical protein
MEFDNFRKRKIILDVVNHEIYCVQKINPKLVIDRLKKEKCVDQGCNEQYTISKFSRFLISCVP